mmetsp:Transcript_107855/g.337381  ORF Transcript_107855/g.337381 Transcript_107855/m.337381 type:complete len:218 (-) Transcript_107855:368-1021(-)
MPLAPAHELGRVITHRGKATTVEATLEGHDVEAIPDGLDGAELHGLVLRGGRAEVQLADDGRQGERHLAELGARQRRAVVDAEAVLEAHAAPAVHGQRLRLVEPEERLAVGLHAVQASLGIVNVSQQYPAVSACAHQPGAVGRAVAALGVVAHVGRVRGVVPHAGPDEHRPACEVARRAHHLGPAVGRRLPEAGRHQGLGVRQRLRREDRQRAEEPC